jgi:hypothetical protein
MFFVLTDIHLAGWRGRVIRWILKWIVPRARQAVGERERGKSVAVQIYNQFKKAYVHLASLLQSEGVLHDPDLIFYFSHYELRSLVRHHRVRLSIHIANQRRVASQFYQCFSMKSLSLGCPVPDCIRSLDESSHESSALNRPQSVSGMPVLIFVGRFFFFGRFSSFIVEVSPGVVVGRVCVIRSVSDASQIQKGDILIAPYTDVGWTVYFALLSGLVTELGGWTKFSIWW